MYLELFRSVSKEIILASFVQNYDLVKGEGQKSENKFPKPKLAIVEQNIIFSAKLSSEEITILAPWYCLRLLSSGCGSNPKPTIYAFSICIFEIVLRKGRK